MGDKLVSVNGEDLTIEDYYIELTEEPVSVYNFQVEDLHTYFIGDCAVWVHNADCDQIVSQLDVNKENGKAFNQKLEKIASDNPNTEMIATEIPMNIEGGKQYRADLIVKKKNGEFIYVEGKSSATAPHTTNQKLDFADNNGKLIGDAHFTKKGTTIFGTDV